MSKAIIRTYVYTKAVYHKLSVLWNIVCDISRGVIFTLFGNRRLVVVFQPVHNDTFIDSSHCLNLESFHLETQTVS